MGTDIFAGCGVTRVRTAANVRASRVVLPSLRENTRALGESGKEMRVRMHASRRRFWGAGRDKCTARLKW
eukprot:7270348-Prymnesium_polylepis.1